MAIKNINTDLTVNGEAQIGATSYQGDMNGGKADFSVDCGGTPEISFIGNYLQAGSTDQNWAMRLYTGVLHTYNQDLYITAGGTGTTNKLRLGTNGQTSTIVCDDGGVGIGTASPSYKLDVNGTLGSTQLHIQGGYALGSSANFLYIDPNTQFSSGIYINNAVKVDGGLLGSYNEDLQLRTGNDTRLTLSSSTGNVGIGTTSPSKKLDVDGEAIIDSTLFLRADGGSNYTASRIELNSHNNYRGAGLYLNGVNRTWYAGSPYTDFAGKFIIAKTDSSSDRGAAQASNALFTILSGGNVGIGTDSPAEKLHVGGDIRVGNGGASDYNRVEFTRYGGAIVGGIGWHTDTKFYIGGHPNLGSAAGNDVRVYGFGSDLHLGDNTNGDVVTIQHSSGNVGIGTASPVAKLQVKGADSLNAFKVTDAGDGDGFKITSHTTQGTYVQVYDASHTQTINLDARSDNTNRHTYFNGGGNVGIGTTSPTHKLDVRGDIVLKGGSTQHSVIRFKRSDSAYDFAYIGFEDPTAANDEFLISSTGNGNPIKIQAGVGDTIHFYGDTTAYGGFDGNGNFGIGTTSPSSKLHVAGQIMISPSSGTPSLKFQDSGTTNAYIDLTDGQQRFDFRDDSDTVMSVTLNTLRVGIGTTSPDEVLEVKGIIKSENTGYTNTGIIINQTSHSDAWRLMQFGGGAFSLNLNGYTGGESRFSVSTSGDVSIPAGTLTVSGTGNSSIAGNVGIGTTNPATRLYVKETGAANTAIFENSGQAYSFAAIKVAESQNNKAVLSFAVGDALASTDIFGEINGIVTNNGGALTGDLYFKTNQGDNMQERMRILANGNVGIGTTAPDTKLHVTGSNYENFTIQSTSSGYAPASVICEAGNSNSRGAGIFMHNTVNDRIWYAGTVYGGNTAAWNLCYDSDASALGAGRTSIAQNSYSLLTVTNDGNVGIGTTSPATSLEVDGSIAATGVLNAYTTSGSTQIGFDGTSSFITANAGGGSNANLKFYSGSNAERMVILSNGNVGIGTTSPAYKLTVNGDVDINNGSLLVQQAYGINLGASGYDVLMPSTTRVGIQTAATERLSILNNGNVGIGDTTPSYKLDVNGTLRTTGQAYFNSNVTITGSATMAGGTMTGNLEINTDRAVYNASYFGTSTASTRSKFRLYGTDTKYAIGMQNNCTYGGLGNTWAMTFQFSNSNTRGFWWGDDGHSQAQGAMALTTDGNLTVASRIRVGYGESDTTTPATYALDATGEVAVTSGDVELTTASRGIILKSPNGTRYLVNINDSGELTTSAV